MSKKTLVTTSMVIVVIIIAGVFVMQKRSKVVVNQVSDQAQQTQSQTNNNQQTHDQSQQIQDNQLVWYEISELNIKFQVEKEIASDIGYKDNDYEKGRFGYKLYAKNYPKYPEITKLQVSSVADSFAVIASYDFKNGILSDCPAYPTTSKLLLKTNTRIICYLDEVRSQEFNKNEKIDQKFDPITKKLFDNYLKNVPFEEIK